MLLGTIRGVLPTFRPLSTTSWRQRAAAVEEASDEAATSTLAEEPKKEEPKPVLFGHDTDKAFKGFGYRRHEVIVRDWRNWEPKTWTPWLNWRMKKCYKRRILVEEFGEDRTRFTALATTDLLPDAIRDEAAEQLSGKTGIGLPRYSDPAKLKRRCNVTSRGHGNVYRYRVSRFIYRDFADHGKLAGVIRARWG